METLKSSSRAMSFGLEFILPNQWLSAARALSDQLRHLVSYEIS
jgi:hypothetical protein